MIMEAKALIGIFREVGKGISHLKEWAGDVHNIAKAADGYSARLEKLHNIMKVLDMSRPMKLREIYVRANILEKPTARHGSNIGDLIRFFGEFGGRFGETKETRDGLAIVNDPDFQKLIVLGKPGAGKTTFLKRLIFHALDRELSQPRVPVYIILKEWSDSDDSLFEFIVNQFEICGFPEKTGSAFVTRLLTNGNALILLDGFDEVTRDLDKAIKQIKDLSNTYPDNQYVLSCRIAAFNYTFEHFTEVEMADFNEEQIETFVANWFSQKDSGLANPCWAEIKGQAPIKELAASPLLLTMMCMVYDAHGRFPSNRASLYKMALEALLYKWDNTRRNKRDDVYKELDLIRKEQLLSQIAYNTFENGEYFIEQARLEEGIVNYLTPLIPLRPLHSSDGENVLHARIPPRPFG